MLFHNLICGFPVVFTLFYLKYGLKFSILVFLIMAPPQKLVLAPGATIRENTVFIPVKSGDGLDGSGLGGM